MTQLGHFWRFGAYKYLQMIKLGHVWVSVDNVVFGIVTVRSRIYSLHFDVYLVSPPKILFTITDQDWLDILALALFYFVGNLTTCRRHVSVLLRATIICLLGVRGRLFNGVVGLPNFGALRSQFLVVVQANPSRLHQVRRKECGEALLPGGDLVFGTCHEIILRWGIFASQITLSAFLRNFVLLRNNQGNLILVNLHFAAFLFSLAH